MDNPYLNVAKPILSDPGDHGLFVSPFDNHPQNNQFPDGIRTSHEWREQLVRQFAWGVPNEESIDTLVQLAPIVEIGSGTGYWAHLVRQAAGDDSAIVATDIDPPNGIGMHTRIEQLSATEAIREHPDRTLFTCWPEYDVDWPAEALDAYEGDCVVYVGEHHGGCNANDRFHEILSEEFDETQRVELHQHSGLHDDMRVYQRASGGHRGTQT